ncbi:ABC transporter substrate-binding protein [Desulfolutivibrio sp.]|uniref:ABC transporter substrate-binding protein n=1 Tax=Desulfolutivibrio sp. TaxID=2773296 RepID=UPI002F963A68
MLPRILIVLAALFLCSTSAFAAEATGEPILVGGLFAQSGPAAFVGTPSRLVAEMTVKKINAAGGILGRPIKLVIHDTESNPDVALRMARQLVEAENVLAIIGPTSTGEGLAVKKYTEEKKVPTIMTVGGDPIIAGGNFGPFTWTFKTPQRTSTAVEKIYDYLKAKGITSVAVMTAKDAFGQDGLNHLKNLAGKYGMNIVAEETFDPKGTDFSAQAFKLTTASPKAVIIWTIGPAGAIVAKNFAALPGDKPLVVECHGQPGSEFLQLAGPAAGGVVMPATKLMAPDSLPASDPQAAVVRAFIADYDKEGIQAKFPINTHSGYAFDALILLQAGLQKAGKADPAALRDALETLTDVVGVSGVFTITPEDHNGLSTDSMIMLEVVDGKYQVAK